MSDDAGTLVTTNPAGFRPPATYFTSWRPERVENQFLHPHLQEPCRPRHQVPHKARADWMSSTKIESTLRQACPGSNPGAMCVQKFDDSRNSAIHTTYRALLRSSSMWEPRNPLYSVLRRFRHGQHRPMPRQQFGD